MLWIDEQCQALDLGSHPNDEYSGPVSSKNIHLYRLGQVAYRDALAWQLEIAAAVRSQETLDSLALLEHTPVYTVGAQGGQDHLLVEETGLQARGAELVRSDRGGDITFHGPGQVVLYTIMNLRRRKLRPADHVRRLEKTVIETLETYGLVGRAVKGRPGVWIGPRKIAAIGVSIRGGVTMHGTALNVTTDLSWFNAIVPCGLHGLGVTSMSRELSTTPMMPEVEEALLAAFARVYETEIKPAHRSREMVHGI